MSRLKKIYYDIIVPDFINRKLAKNILDVPRLLKIVVNMGLGTSLSGKKSIDDILSELALITNQKPVITNARKSIAGFKLRKGFSIGCKVTLRKLNMYNFLDKLLCVVLPRIRDFRGLSLKSFDGKGNYSFGIKEYIVFPEINYDKIDIIRGMDISIVTNSKTNEHGKMLLQAFKFPFKN